MKVLGLEISDKAYYLTQTIGVGALGSYFVVYPVVTHAAETVKTRLPGATKGFINHVISPVLTELTSWVAPIIPTTAKVSMIFLAACAAKKCYDERNSTRYSSGNLRNDLTALSKDSIAFAKSLLHTVIEEVRSRRFDFSLHFSSTPSNSLPSASAAASINSSASADGIVKEEAEKK